MKAIEGIVYVVDDDVSIHEALSSLIRLSGLQVETFASGTDFLSHQRPDMASCLILDVCLPDESGLDLQRRLADAGDRIPIIFVTGRGDIPMSVRAMKAGAAEFLQKPFREQDLLDAIRQALERDEATRRRRAKLAETRIKYDTLTSREREVLLLVIKGVLNKQAAADLGIAEITIKVHRRHIMKKMCVKSLLELVRLAEILGLTAKAEPALDA